TVENDRLLLKGQVPQPDRLVPAPGGQRPAVGGGRDALDAAVMPLERDHFLVFLQVPDSDRAIIADAGEACVGSVRHALALALTLSARLDISAKFGGRSAGAKFGTHAGDEYDPENRLLVALENSRLLAVGVEEPDGLISPR